MPPKTKTDTGTNTAPASSATLCGICEPSTLDPSTTAWGCEHGVWTFSAPGEPALPPGASAEEQLAVLLSNLDQETLRKLLDLKAAGEIPADPPKPDAAPVKADPVDLDPVKAEPVKAEPVKAEPVKADPKYSGK